MRVFLGAAAAACALALGLAPAAAARPYTVDDLLQEASLGGGEIDPSGRWAVFETRAPYGSLGRYPYGMRTSAALTRLWRADLRRPGQVRPLLAEDVGPGVLIAGFSPSGRRIAVYRLAGARWSLGLVTVATGEVRWLPVTPEAPQYGRPLQWLSDDTLLVLDRPDGTLPWTLRRARIAAERYPALWDATARGEASVKVLGSGTYLGVRAKAAPLRLVRVDAATGAVSELARGDFTDLEVAPDGRHVALFEAGADLQPRADGPAQGAAGTQTEAHGLVLLDLASGHRRDVLRGVDLLPHLLAWSPGGRSLLVYGRVPGADWTSGRLRIVSASTGDARAVGEGLALQMSFRPDVVAAGWMGETWVAYGRTLGASRSDWYRETETGLLNLTVALPQAPRTLASLNAGGLLAVVDGGVWRVDRGGHALRLRSEPAVATAPARTSAPGRLAVAPAGSSWLSVSGRLVHAVRGGLSPSPLRAVDGDLLAVSETADNALVRRQDGAGRMRMVQVSPQGEIALLEVNPGLAATPAPRVLPVRHAGPDGRDVTSWLFLPPQGDGPPPPLVIVPYAGTSYPTPPRDLVGEPGYLISLRMLVGHGYAVLMPSLPLARDAEPMAGWGPRLVEIAGIAAAQPETAGTFDPNRMALWGYSFGGYTVAAALGQTDAFRAGVSIAGPMDLISKWAATHPETRPAPDEGVTLAWTSGNTENGQNRMLAPPWVDPTRYLRNSPLLAADRIRTPLLLIHGDQDSIELAQSEAMFAALFRQSKDAMLLTYWGESHGFASPGNIRDLYARAFAFLDAHLCVVSGSSPQVRAHPGSASASSGPMLPPSPPIAAGTPPDGR